MADARKNKRRARRSLALALFLLVALILTTYALASSIASVPDNRFQTGRVSIELNGGRRIFNGEDMNMEPGYAAKKDFTIENTGNADAYYRLYLENMGDALADSLIFELYEGDTLLYSSPAADFTQENPYVSNQILPAHTVQVLTAVIRMREGSGNLYQNAGFTFDLTVDAVQARNNAGITFGDEKAG